MFAGKSFPATVCSLLTQLRLVSVSTWSSFGRNRNSTVPFCRNPRNQAETIFLGGFGRNTVTETEFRSVSRTKYTTLDADVGRPTGPIKWLRLRRPAPMNLCACCSTGELCAAADGLCCSLGRLDHLRRVDGCRLWNRRLLLVRHSLQWRRHGGKGEASPLWVYGKIRQLIC